jgi:methyl-accepting chemotaxis protein
MKSEINGFNQIGEQINSSSSDVLNTADKLDSLAQKLQSQVNQFTL